MFEKSRLYRTALVRESGNDYIEGRISGVIYAVAKEYKDQYSFMVNVYRSENRHVTLFTVDTTKSRYKKITEIIKTMYPDEHIEFDVDIMEFLKREG